MTYEFCTLFDRAYLARALVLHRSLAEHVGDFRLRAFCMDADTCALLAKLALDRVEAISIEELEAHDRELLQVKGTRTKVEYYWTATPAICLYCLERDPGLQSITYLDADLMFYSSPQPIFDELGDNSVLIVPHRFPEHMREHARLFGVYNVQFLTFRRTNMGLAALDWWRERCLEWCYSRSEAGRFGDQKYLDDWPSRFADVHVLEHQGAGVAPWNIEQYQLASNRHITVSGTRLIFFHFHSLRLHTGLNTFGRLRLLRAPFWWSGGQHPIVWSVGDYETTALERNLIWEPYVRRIGDEIARIRRVDPSFDAGFSRERVSTGVAVLARAARRHR